MDYLLKETARLLVMRDKLMSLITLRVYESSFTELLTMSVRVRDVHIGRSSCRIKLLLFLLSVCNVVEARPAGETRLLKAASRAANNGRSTDNVRPDRGLDRSNSGLAGHFDRSFLDINILFSIELSLNAL